MPCEHHKDALIEAAATGAEPQGELRLHLAACAACRSAFEQEQSLFASIDAGLLSTGNAEVPASLLPRVRARLTESAPSRRMWTHPLVFATASVALAFSIFLFARLHHSIPDHQARQSSQVPVSEKPVPNPGHQNSGPNTQIVSSNMNDFQTPGHSTLLRPVTSSQPEVLVPPDEREAFSHFVVALQERSDVAAALLAPGPKKQDALVTLEPLQIADLVLKPLEWQETEIPSRVGEQQ